MAASRAVTDLRHPHIVTMRRSSEGPGFEREANDGLTFAQLTDGPTGDGSLALRIRIRILLDVLSGLAALHRVRLDGKPVDFVHGEVAPHNIVVGRDGLGRLVPLAASHWSDPPIPDAASLGYVAPERLLGDVFDQRADVFSIGVLLWEAMAERRLFRNQRMDAIVTQLVGGKVSRPPPPPGAPWADALADVAMQALSVDPSHRWPHVGVMGAEIETITEGCLASSEEIALLVRHRLSGDRASFIPGAAASTSMVPQVSSIPQSRDSSPPPISESRVSRSRSNAPPGAGLVVWHGPNERTPSDGARERDSFRPSYTPGSSMRRRPSQAAITRQSRIVWTAVGVGLALFALTIYELFDRESPSPAPALAATPNSLPAQPAPMAAGRLPDRPGPAPAVAAPREITPPSTPPRRPEPNRPVTRSPAPVVAPAAAQRSPPPPRPPVSPPVAAPVVKAPAPAPLPPPAASAPPAPEPPAPPPPPKDDFGI